MLRSSQESRATHATMQDRSMLQEGTTSATAMEEEEQYVKVESRFFRVKKPRGGGSSSSSSMASISRLHYLESCFLCKKDISCDRDIFMYKGDAAFCSEDCRLDQMEMDEALHALARRHRLLSSSHQAPALGEASPARPPMMRRRPTIANLAARNPPVTAS